MKKPSFKALPLALLAIFSAHTLASDADIAALNSKVSAKVEQIEATGLLPTAQEIELITGDIVDQEVETTAITVPQAVEKYDLTPTLERYIELKEAGREQKTSNGLHPPAATAPVTQNKALLL